MSLKLLLALTMTAGASSVLGWHQAGLVLCAGALALFLAIGCGVAPAALLARLQATCGRTPLVASWGARNVIVLLTAGSERVPAIGQIEPGLFGYGRIAKAVELYRACKREGRACTIIVSGGDMPGHGLSEAEVYAACLHRLGTEAGDLVLEAESLNAWQNARFTADLLRRQRADRVLLVSSGYHLQRGCLYFAHFGVEAIPVRADYLAAALSPWPLAYNFAVADVAMHEYIGMARYHAYNLLGWNITAAPRGSVCSLN